ncbi:hypothetical protein ABIE44_000367 [Marmoricola sp. OAE513]|uniref:hypothetical protein n=1 Tax=Marmoricola sp. OAE513 TaxID=2817894 RepID=UPI001AEAB48B
MRGRETTPAGSGPDLRSQVGAELSAQMLARLVTPAQPEIPESDLHGTWRQPKPRRIFGQALLALALVGAGVGLFLTLWVQTFDALAVLVAFTNIALMTYTALSVSTPTTVTLDGPVVSVRRGRETDDFDLTGPVRRIIETGRTNRPNWRVRLETADGKVVELGPTQIDPVLMHAAITRYRAPRVPQQRTGD